MELPIIVRVMASIVVVVFLAIVCFFMVTNCGCVTVVLAAIVIGWIFMQWMKERRGD